MFSFFERLIAPFPSHEPTQPPKGLLAFCRHYTKGAERYLILMALLSGAIAMTEVALFGFMGDLVDWLIAKNPDTLLQEESGRLWGMAFMVWT